MAMKLPATIQAAREGRFRASNAPRFVPPTAGGLFFHPARIADAFVPLVAPDRRRIVVSMSRGSGLRDLGMLNGIGFLGDPDPESAEMGGDLPPEHQTSLEEATAAESGGSSYDWTPWINAAGKVATGLINYATTSSGDTARRGYGQPGYGQQSYGQQSYGRPAGRTSENDAASAEAKADAEANRKAKEKMQLWTVIIGSALVVGYLWMRAGKRAPRAAAAT